MSAELKTQYTSVYVSTDDADPKQHYFGYLAVNFNLLDKTAEFFMETYELELLNQLKEFFKSKPNYMVDKDIRIEDGSILIDLPRVADKIFASDLLKMVKQVEEEFNEKAGF